MNSKIRHIDIDPESETTEYIYKIERILILKYKIILFKGRLTD